MADGEFAGSARARRAVALITVALTVIVVAGLTWLRMSAPPPAPVFPIPSPTPVLGGNYSAAYDFISPSTGWALITSNARGRGMQVFRTDDGAGHWQDIYSGALAPVSGEIHFLDRTHGYIKAWFNELAIFRTSDGGTHWQPMSFPTPPTEVAFADWTHIWFLTFDRQAPSIVFELYSSKDGGLTWHHGSLPAGSFLQGKPSTSDFLFRPDGEGWIGSDDNTPVTYSTSDGGETWHPHTIAVSASAFPPGGKGAPPGAPAFSVAAQILPKSGVIAFVRDYNGDTVALTSFDEGLTWRAVTAPPNLARYEEVTFLDGRRWWDWHVGFLYKTSDAGATWHETHVAPVLDNWTYSPAHVIDSQHAWSSMIFAGTSSSALSMTTDGGSSWHTVHLPKPG
jgi:photosystem II stability/assembly factor-like uncharacterized protein